jgi:transposase
VSTSADDSVVTDSLGRRTGPRRQHSLEAMRQIVEETHVKGASVSSVARRHEVNPNQVFAWRQSNCPQCGGSLRTLADDVSEVLEYVPEHWKVHKHIRPKYSCGSCQTIVQASAPSRPIERSYAGPA